MTFNPFGFVLGSVVARREGVTDRQDQTRVGLLGGLVGSPVTGLALSTVVARREAEDQAPPASGTPAPEQVEVPEVVEENVTKAEQTLKSLGLVPSRTTVASTQEKDKVLSQDPEKGTVVPRNSTVRLIVSSGFSEDLTVEVIDVTPEDSAVRVDTATNVKAVFSKEMDRATLTDQNFTLVNDANREQIPVKVTPSSSDQKVTLDPFPGTTPPKVLDPNTKYVVTIKAAVKDKDGDLLEGGNQPNGDYQWSFTTAVQPGVSTVSIEDFSFSPADLTVAPGTTVKWVNNDQASHTSTADDGTVAGPMWDSGKLQPGKSFSFTFDQVGTYTYHCSIHPTMTGTIKVDGGQPVELTVKVRPAAHETTVGWETNVDAIFSNKMNESTINKQNFTLVNKGTGQQVEAAVNYDQLINMATLDPKDQLHSDTTYTATLTAAVKDTEGHSLKGNQPNGDYQWSFTTAGQPAKPWVVDVTPQQDATEVPIDTNVEATFSKEMDASTINKSTFTLRQLVGNQVVEAAVNYDAATKKAILDPSGSLQPDTRHYTIVTEEIKDKDGNPLYDEWRWGFRTAGEAGKPWVVGVTPQQDATEVPIDTNVEATFSKEMDASTINKSTFWLQDDTGELLEAAINYDAAAKKAILDPSEDLLTGTRYVPTVWKQVKDKDGNNPYDDFRWWFTTAGQPAKPTVDHVAPEDHATEVPIDTNVEAIFSKEMDASTINKSTFMLVGQGASQPVDAAINYDAATKKAILDPSGSLLTSTKYVAMVKKGIKSKDGYPFPFDLDWDFTTGGAS